VTSIEKVVSPAPTIDSKIEIFDAIEYLITCDCNHAFIQHEGEMVGTVATDCLLENYRSKDMSGVSIMEFMQPLLMIKEGEPQTRAAEIMSEHCVECIVVTNREGVFLGVAALNDL
jgi:predicted transcriptional regulator